MTAEWQSLRTASGVWRTHDDVVPASVVFGLGDVRERVVHAVNDATARRDRIGTRL